MNGEECARCGDRRKATSCGGVSASRPVDPARSREPVHVRSPHAREPGSPRCSPVPLIAGGPLKERRGGKPGMNERGKSDGCVVPAKPANTAAVAAAESVGWPRGTWPAKRIRTQCGTDASGALGRVRGGTTGQGRAGSLRCCTMSVSAPTGRLIGQIRPQAAQGVDGVTWDAYGQAPGGESPGSARVRCDGGRYRRRDRVAQEAAIPRPDGRQAAVGNRRAGGQDRSAGGRRSAQRRLRGGLSGLLVRVSAWA